MHVSDPDWARLLDEAKRAAECAYCPYSRFPVGAAVLTAGGDLFAGCNIENASYGLTVCAERNAVFQMVAAGQRVIRAVLVYTPIKTAAVPCGACRQVIYEFGAESLVRWACDSQDPHTMPLAALLPHAFGPQNLAEC